MISIVHFFTNSCAECESESVRERQGRTNARVDGSARIHCTIISELLINFFCDCIYG